MHQQSYTCRLIRTNCDVPLVSRVIYLRDKQDVIMYSQNIYIFVTASVTFHWSPFVRCSIYYKPEVIFKYSCNQEERCRKFVPLARKHKTQLH